MAPGSDEYVCSACGKQFDSKEALADHVKDIGLVH